MVPCYSLSLLYILLPVSWKSSTCCNRVLTHLDTAGSLPEHIQLALLWGKLGDTGVNWLRYLIGHSMWGWVSLFTLWISHTTPAVVMSRGSLGTQPLVVVCVRRMSWSAGQSSWTLGSGVSRTTFAKTPVKQRRQWLTSGERLLSYTPESLQGSGIEMVDSFRYLGVQLNNKLDWFHSDAKVASTFWGDWGPLECADLW